MSDHALTVTPEQARDLASRFAAADLAKVEAVAYFTACVHGHGIVKADYVSLEGTTLTVRVPDEAT